MWKGLTFHVPSLQALDGLSIKELNSLINAQNQMEDLSRIVQAAALLEIFDYIHAATAVTTAGHLLKEEKENKSPMTKTISPESAYQFAAIIRVDNFKPQALSNTAWSLAVMEHDDPVFMTQLLAAATPKLPGFSPQALSNLAYALAKQKQRGAPDPQGLEVFLGELVLSAAEQLGCFSAKALSNTAWAMAIIGHDDPVFMTQFIVAARPKLHEFKPQELSNMAYALAKQKQPGTPDPQGLDAFMKELVQTATEQLGGFSVRDMCAIAWAMSRLGYRDLNFQLRARAIIESRGDMLSRRQRANLKL